ncbi:hypothetical protein F3Y22_tig00111851pilonHSYRG00109 [Hibiscus syriacus]|uniref:Major facilitator superfamily protein n=1 Tax=Hibiscus syriacus TaxID=106335 RepID=A0A6A2YFD8_HIBSY|nr:hypothetical protein F3Y22_tig00111851pilonHSYRG00109 [Hibiscus syriacus]
MGAVWVDHKLRLFAHLEEVYITSLTVMSNSIEDDSFSKPVGRWSVYCYGVGHMLNDITSACWFTYLLLFLTEIGLSSRDAAIVMLSGQIADGLATIFFGELVHGELHHSEFNEQSSACKLSECLYNGQLLSPSLYGIAFIIFEVIKAKTPTDIEIQFKDRYTRKYYCKDFMDLLVFENSILSSCFVYTLTRLVLNVSQAYLAFYVIDDLRMVQSAKALVPAIIYISSFIVSLLLQEIAWNEKRLKAYYTVGGILWIFCGIAIVLLPQSMSLFVYAISIFIGIANALMTVTAVSMQNILIGQDLNGCAFVCGSLSFLDKISCGLTLFVLQSYHSSSPIVAGNIGSGHFSITRYGLGLVPAICSLVGVAVTWTMELRYPLYKPLMETLLE